MHMVFSTDVNGFVAAEAGRALVETSFMPGMVFLSYAIAVIAAYSALRVADTMRRAQTDINRAIWLVAGAVAMGSGIWAMHFVGMLAVDLPFDVGYDAIETLLSVIPAILAAAVALHVTSMPMAKQWQVILGGLLMGAGIGSMHYSGMMAMLIPGVMVHDPWMFVGSIVLAVVLATLALMIYRSMVNQHMMASAVMGLAITAMHYVGVVGVTFVTDTHAVPAPSTSTSLLALAVTFITMLVIGLAVVATLVEHMVQRISGNKKRYQNVINASPNAVCTIKDGVITYANPAAEKFVDLKIARLTGRHLRDFVHSDYDELFDAENIKEVMGSSERVPLKLVSVTGDQLDVWMTGNAIAEEGEGVYVIEFQDVTEAKKTARDILSREQYMRTILDNAAEGIVTMDSQGHIETFNAAAQKLFGYTASRIEGADFNLLLDEGAKNMVDGEREVSAMRFDGETFPAEIAMRSAMIGEQEKGIAIIRDITKRKDAEEEVRYLATHDPLTGLPNRRVVHDKIQRAVRGQNMPGVGAVLFLSLIGRQRINDAHGHAIGEQALRMAAERLKGVVGDNGCIGNWTGADFVAVVTGASAMSNLDAFAASFHEALKKPMFIEGHEIDLACAIGSTVFPANGTNAEHLVRGAGMAMFKGRQLGALPMMAYSMEMDHELTARNHIESEMRHALSRDQFQVYYQPKIDLSTGNIMGMEALIRWIHPDLGFISPADFIPIAEETGLIKSIGAWVLKTACEDTKRWIDQGHALKCAVNLSGRQFEDADLIDQVRKIMSDTGLKPENLELEVTESSLMSDVEEGMRVLSDLRDEGISIAIDDFGTGYSSLSYLKKLPINTLKIDQSFVFNVTEDADDAAIAATILGMAACLGLKVVAEGIETPEHAKFLTDLNCDIGQGYHFSRPVNAEAFEVFLTEIPGMLKVVS